MEQIDRAIYSQSEQTPGIVDVNHRAEASERTTIKMLGISSCLPDPLDPTQ